MTVSKNRRGRNLLAHGESLANGDDEAPHPLVKVG